MWETRGKHEDLPIFIENVTAASHSIRGDMRALIAKAGSLGARREQREYN